MKKRFHWCVNKINASKYIANHIAGEQHTMVHRRLVGTIIILIGAIISHTPVSSHLLQIPIESFGWTLHGIGAIPFIQKFEKNEPNTTNSGNVRKVSNVSHTKQRIRAKGKVYISRKIGENDWQ